MKVVITGAPCTGKSTLVSFFSSVGFKIVSEGATAVMQRTGIRKPQNLPPFLRDEFRRKVVRHYEGAANDNSQSYITFFDRSIIDSIAYAKLEGQKCPKYILDKIKKGNLYDQVFILRNNPTPYQNTDIRRTSEREAKELGILIRSAYTNNGYKVVDIDEVNFSKRVEIIATKVGFRAPILKHLLDRSVQLKL